MDRGLIGDILNSKTVLDSIESSPEIQINLRRCQDILAAQNAFVENTCPIESELQCKIARGTQEDPNVSDKSFMLSGHVIGQFVKMMAEMAQAKDILDIGMYTEYSAITLGETTFCEKVVSLDINEYFAEFVKQKIEGTPLEKKIQIMIGPAIESLAALKAEKECFDLVFIDADKTSYLDYYKFIMDNGLLKKNGCILCDNVFWHNDTILDRKSSGGQALYDLVEFVKKDPRVDQMILPYRDGLMVIKSKAV